MRQLTFLAPAGTALRRTALALALALVGVSGANAHDTDVQGQLVCTPASPSDPLVLECQATAVYAGDEDPVLDARVDLGAMRPLDGNRVTGQRLLPTGEAGHYSGRLALPAYGTWVIAATVAGPAEGVIELSKEVLPPSGAQSGVSSARARLIATLGVADVFNIGALLAHLAGTALLFAATGAVLGAHFLGQSEPAQAYRRRVARLFPWAAGASFAVLAVSGLYNAINNAPIRSPGLLRPDILAGLPFGPLYLGVFVFKLTLGVVLAIGTVVLAIRLRRSIAWVTPTGTPDAEAIAARASAAGARSSVAASRVDSCVALAAANLVIGALLVASAVVAEYLHLLAHASLSVGA